MTLCSVDAAVLQNPSDPLLGQTLAGKYLVEKLIKRGGMGLKETWSKYTMGFLDLRQWVANLEQQGELRRITAEVDWDREIGAITRRVLEKKGPALLFENVKG